MIWDEMTGAAAAGGEGATMADAKCRLVRNHLGSNLLNAFR
jgi:hypothetical protein